MIGYVTLEEAKEWLSERYDIESIEDTTLTKALHRAFDKIEQIPVRFKGEGEKVFPRMGEKEVPFLVKMAQMLEAYSIATGKEEEQAQMLNGITSKSIGDMSVAYDKSKKAGLANFCNAQAAQTLKKFERKSY
ncbi:DnaT-like ssDNA-binding protein [Fusobacterium sp. THCT1E2]